MKYRYCLTINQSSRNIIKEATYNYGVVRNIKIVIGKKFGQVSFEMNTKKSFDDFINFKISPVKDALIKIHLMYALLNHKGLEVEHITCQINDDEKVYDSDSENFPFLFSMIATNDLNLSGNWEGVCDGLVQQSKTMMNQDARYSAIYAYLMSKGREFEYD
ncbi:MAG: hypothetical protein K6F77_03045, partial [Lachnospiraceae bacterium]|nr:hypothetical protein [Lachnospiraceae bacterium]